MSKGIQVKVLPKMSEAEKAEYCLRLLNAANPSVPYSEVDRVQVAKEWLRHVASKDIKKGD